ncbi:phospholipase A2 inhibitor beta-like [Uranotaenia lowii]|uniref:phospholipase A2 inhibitor beta-like n=1 Tax=Uranotaenia lowii TaxID=190385 RepID=UPI002479E5D9|nr:phospholipase A2 inhibitor beta-like [Uranotaenia lowii]
MEVVQPTRQLFELLGSKSEVLKIFNCSMPTFYLPTTIVKLFVADSLMEEFDIAESEHNKIDEINLKNVTIKKLPNNMHILQHLITIDFKNVDTETARLSDFNDVQTKFLRLDAVSRNFESSLISNNFLELLKLSNFNHSNIDVGNWILPKLKHLILSDNKLTTLPSNCHSIAHIQTLSMDSNMFQELEMNQFSIFTRIKEINMGNNLIERIIVSEGLELPLLESLCFKNNLLTDVMALELISMPNIDLLDLTKNRLQTVDLKIEVLHTQSFILIAGNPIDCEWAKVEAAREDSAFSLMTVVMRRACSIDD